MFKKIKIKLFVKFILTIAVIIVATSYFLSRFFIGNHTQTVKDELKNRGRYLANNLSYSAELGVLANDVESLSNLVKKISLGKDLVYVGILDKEGRVLAQSSSASSAEKGPLSIKETTSSWVRPRDPAMPSTI